MRSSFFMQSWVMKLQFTSESTIALSMHQPLAIQSLTEISRYVSTSLVALQTQVCQSSKTEIMFTRHPLLRSH